MVVVGSRRRYVVVGLAAMAAVGALGAVVWSHGEGLRWLSDSDLLHDRRDRFAEAIDRLLRGEDLRAVAL